MTSSVVLLAESRRRLQVPLCWITVALLGTLRLSGGQFGLAERKIPTTLNPALDPHTRGLGQSEFCVYLQMREGGELIKAQDTNLILQDRWMRRNAVLALSRRLARLCRSSLSSLPPLHTLPFVRTVCACLLTRVVRDAACAPSLARVTGTTSTSTPARQPGTHR